MKYVRNKTAFALVIMVFLLLTLGPIIWCLVVSITPENEMFNGTVQFLPKHPTFENYRVLLNFTSQESSAFMKCLLNSSKAVVTTVLIGIPVSMMAAYALSRLKFRGRETVRISLLITIVIPIFTTIIPLYAMFADFGILDNIFWLSLVYVSSFLPLTTWLFTNYINTIPKELDEAAFIDGCGKIRTFFKIILPNSYSMIFAVILLIFLMTWSQYQIPLILASSTSTKPMSMIVAEFSSKDIIKYGMTATAGILALIPPTVFAVIFRGILIAGLTQGKLGKRSVKVSKKAKRIIVK